MTLDQSGAFPWNQKAPEPSNPETAGASRHVQMDDLRCVAAVRRGESEAFGEIVRRYQDRLFNTILRLLGDYEEARRLHLKYSGLFRDLFIDTNPIPVKTSLALMGKIGEEMRLPLVPMAQANLDRLKKTLHEYGLIVPLGEWEENPRL